MKVYAKQVAPEYQESPLFWIGCLPDNIVLKGNREYKKHIPENIENVLDALQDGELSEMLEDEYELKQWYESIEEAINYYLPKESGEYTEEEISRLKELIEDFDEEDGTICEVLSIVTGKTWDYGIITGCSQSDWQDVLYPAEEWSREDLEAFEMEYFNTGTEWIIDDGDFDPDTDSPLNINGYSVYAHHWRDEDIREEIANVAGAEPEDVVMFAFEGWTSSEAYREV